MIRNYLTIALRTLRSQKVSSFINIFGLALGMACCMLIGLYIREESSYDRHWQDSERLYRVANEVFFGDSHVKAAALAAPIAPVLGAQFAEVEAVTRLLPPPDVNKSTFQIIGNGETQEPFFETKGFMADSAFFQVFAYQFVYGNPLTALKEPNSVVLSDVVAQKLFGNTNPLNRTLRIGNNYGENDYRITGVFQSKGNSHIDAHFFTDMQSGVFGQWVSQQTNWATNNLFYTYIKLRKDASRQSLENKFSAFMDQHAGKDMKAAGLHRKLFLQAVPDIHLHSNLEMELPGNGSATYLYILACIGGFILLLACVNFMNLSTARSAKRAKEVGMRKVMGAYKTMIIKQFLSESLLLSLTSFVIACGLTTVLLPLFNKLTGKSLLLSSLVDWQLTGSLLVLILFTGLIAGSYPAFYLSSFRPALVLKGKFSNSLSAIYLRKGLVGFQFVISIGLVLAALVIGRQMNYLQNQHLGFEQHQQLVVPLPTSESQKSYFTYKEEIKKNAGVLAVAGSSTYPGRNNVLQSIALRSPGKSVQEAQDVKLGVVDFGFTEALEFELLAGRFFSPDFPSDTSNAPTAIILNETAVQKLGYRAESAIGKPLYFDWQGKTNTYQVVGVLKDFHFESLHEKIKPIGFVMQSRFTNPPAFLMARVHTQDLPNLINTLESKWKVLNPGTPFEYSFLDEDFQHNYEAEQRTSQLVNYFTIVAILIACMGLYALTAYTAEQRTKEIGIRKVLGASASSIVALLSKDFLKLILLANVIAWPLGWWAMNQWLEDFAYSVKIEWWIFVLAGILAIGIAFLTIGFQSIKAAIANPVKSLRNE